MKKVCGPSMHISRMKNIQCAKMSFLREIILHEFFREIDLTKFYVKLISRKIELNCNLFQADVLIFKIDFKRFK